MFSDFCELFFGAGATPNDFELTFALVFFVLIFHCLASLIGGLIKAVKY